MAISSPEPCPDCSGRGRVSEQRSINVKIPAGVDTGNRVHLQGQGEIGPGAGPAGDLYVEIQVAPHGVFRRDHDNLEMVVKLPMSLAALGAGLDIDTLESELADCPARTSGYTWRCLPAPNPAPVWSSRTMGCLACVRIAGARPRAAT